VNVDDNELISKTLRSIHHGLWGADSLSLSNSRGLGPPRYEERKSPFKGAQSRPEILGKLYLAVSVELASFFRSENEEWLRRLEFGVAGEIGE